jgi:hypothetical protein
MCHCGLDAQRLNVRYKGRTGSRTTSRAGTEKNIVRISLKSARPLRHQRNQHARIWMRLARILALAIFAAALPAVADAKQKHPVPAPAPAVAEIAPPVDPCGHPIVTDNVGAPYKDPVCIALSDRLQPPLYIPEPDCNRGVVPYDSRCFFQRLFTVMTASPGPPPLPPPPPAAYHVK